MTISLDAIYRPLEQFFLGKIEKGQESKVTFRISQVPIGLFDSDFVPTSQPGTGPSPALAAELFSRLVDRVPLLDEGGRGVWLNQSGISDLYHDEMLSPSLPFIPADAAADTKQALIDFFSELKHDALLRWENSKAASLVSSGALFRPSTATPQAWWNREDAQVWTPQEFLIRGAATAEAENSADRLLKMKIPDRDLQPLLDSHTIKEAPTTQRPVPPSRQPISNGLSGSPVRTAVMARKMVPVTVVRAALVPRIVTGLPVQNMSLHSALLARSTKIPQEQRMELEAILHEHAPSQPVNVSDVTISFEYCLVTVSRPWMDTAYVNSKSWFIPGRPKGSLSANDGHGVPGLPVGFIVLKNLRIKGPWTLADISNLEQSVQFGPFLIDSTIIDGAIGHEGIQVVGWILQALPELPPVDDLTLGKGPSE